MTYEDGRTFVTGTDEGFVAGPGAYLYADLYVGEGYDAAKEPVGWMEPVYRNPQWKPVLVKDYGYEQLQGTSDEPAACLRLQTPVQILHSPKGEMILDVGENISGYVSVTGTLRKGDRITLEYCEVLDKEGNFLRNIMGQNKNQTDVYIAGKDGEFSYCPKFTFHGFQYVKVTGLEQASVENFQVHVLGSNLERTGTFSCSDPRLNQLQKNIFRSQQGNMLYVPTDCPQREKAGWTGDMQAYAPTACYLMDVEAFLQKWLVNMQLEQTKDGRIPDVIPDIPSNQLISFGTEQCSSGWGDACVIVPYRLYQAYGTRQILQDNYSMMLQWMRYVERKAATEVPDGYDTSNIEGMEHQKYLWNTGFHYGDWLQPSLLKGGKEPTYGAEITKELVAPAMFAYTTRLMIEISSVLGYQEQEAHFRFLNQKIKEAFTHEYLLENGRLKLDYQGIYVLALQMELVPVESREGLVNRLVELIHENNGCLDTGFLSMPFLLDVLYDNGKQDEAYKLLYQEKCPSWLYEIKQGANTIWESWNNILEDGTRTNSSYNHFAFGCVGDFMYRRILGLQIVTPGYQKIRICPDLTCGLTWAKGNFESIYGLISIYWEQQDDKAVLKVQIPPGVSAEVIFGGQTRQVSSGKYEFTK
jgi:alpha-L-rhamnosidase